MSGIYAVFSFEEVEAFPLIYYGLYALQHRGQGAVGIGTVADEKAYLHLERGLISEHFSKEMVSTMPGRMGIGYVHYEFAGQKFPNVPYERDGALIAIDGCIYNEDFSMKECLRVLGGEFSEISKYLSSLTGKFVMCYMNSERFIAYKNVDGIKPLALGRKAETLIVSSESSGLDAIGGTFIKELQPGELFIQSRDNAFSFYLNNKIQPTENLDAFEFIYTARPDSVLDGISVYEARYRMGENLWDESDPKDAVVIGAPSSGIISSLGYAKKSGLPYQQGFVRNSYVGRSFIQPCSEERARTLQIKLMPIKQNVANRKIILVDDSIVRGSTIKKTVQSLRDAGANEVHVRVASPQIVSDESVTVDIPEKNSLIANQYSLEDLPKAIDCDSIRYLSIEGFHRAIGRNKLYEPYFG